MESTMDSTLIRSPDIQVSENWLSQLPVNKDVNSTFWNWTYTYPFISGMEYVMLPLVPNQAFLGH